MDTRRFLLPAITALALFAATPCRSATAPTTTVIHSFTGDEGGEYPSTDLVLDAAGNLYGTTVQGGAFGGGTVFQLTPSGTGWTHTVLYSFTGGADGGQPYGGVTLDSRGNLYGSAVIGGSGGICAEDGCGVVYKLTNVGGTWVEKVIHDFTGADGSGPGAGVTVDARGNVYGMTPTGGDYGLGVIYRIEPRHGGEWAFHIIHTFTGGTDGGSGSAGRLLLDGAGNLYGVATTGGANGQGVAFRLTPSQSGWTFTTLYAFQGEPDGGFPYGGLVRDASGAFYGTTYYDGEHEVGTAYKLALVNGTWTETVLYSFQGGTDGASPISNLVLDGSGNLYGTTSEGGAAGCGCGTIFRLSRRSDGTWVERVAHRFENVPDGAFPYNGMVSDGAGHFYGSTVHGGADGEGAIYEFAPGGTGDAPEAAQVTASGGTLLLGGAPNPVAGGGVTLHYALPSAGHVRLAVYGVDGRLVRVLRNAGDAAGAHDVVWDGTNDQGVRVSHGAYVCVMDAGGEQTHLRLTLTR